MALRLKVKGRSAIIHTGNVVLAHHYTHTIKSVIEEFLEVQIC